MISTRLCSMKVLIVLDGLDRSDHLEYLAADCCWFGDGSRVVITTRNRQLIENGDAIYEVSTLPDHEAMLLFNQHTFPKKEISDEHFKMFSLEVVNHAKGPFFSPKEPEQKMMFLDMACFLGGYDKIKVLRILHSYNIGAEYELDVLIDKSLVFISRDDRLKMHDLIEDMGRYVMKMDISRSDGKSEASSIHYLTWGELLLGRMENLVALPSSIFKLKCLVMLDMSDCVKVESLPEEIGDIENLEELDAGWTLISRPPSSIGRLNKLKFLNFGKIQIRRWSVICVPSGE
ncbi:hypothetical protein P3S68_020988 [Capsicum galapagoense]